MTICAGMKTAVYNESHIVLCDCNDRLHSSQVRADTL